jgi:hypothetical protein
LTVSAPDRRKHSRSPQLDEDQQIDLAKRPHADEKW